MVSTVILVVYLSLFASFEKFDVIVLGSGISGLSAASFLSQNGKNVVLIEQGYNIGGSIQSFTRVGPSGTEYTFEPGMHILSGDGSDFSSITGEKIEMSPFGEVIDVLYYTNEPHRSMPLPAGVDAMFKTIIERFPDEKDKIDFYISVIQNIKNASFSMDMLFDQMNPSPALRFALSYMEDYTSFANFPVIDYGGLIQFAFANGGATFPEGSTKRIIEGVVNQIKHGKSPDSKIYNNCEAKKLNLDGNKVTGVSTSCGDFEAEYVVSTIGARNTFNPNFIDRFFLEKHGYLSKAESLLTGITGMIHFIGFNISNEYLGLPRGNVWVKNLNEDKNDIFGPSVMFCSCLSCRDPLYPKDRTDFFILNLKDFDLFTPWLDTVTHQRPTDYYEFKQKFEDEAVEWLYSTFPMTRDKIDLIVTSTPLTVRDYLNHVNEHSMEQK